MIKIACTFAALSLVTLVAIGCGSATDSAPVAQVGAEAAGYGYEFPSDRVSAFSLVHRAVPAAATGRLAPELIQNVVRDAFPKIGACYDAGLTNASRAGMLTLRFVIGRDGRVTTIENRASTLENEEAVSCIVNTVAALEFPARNGGVVTVVYPLDFAR